MNAKQDIAERVRTILLKEWDPIGIADEPAAQDEYDTYAPLIVSMLRAGARGDAVARHLLSIEREQMGLPGNESRARQAAELLANLHTA